MTLRHSPNSPTMSNGTAQAWTVRPIGCRALHGRRCSAPGPARVARVSSRAGVRIRVVPDVLHLVVANDDGVLSAGQRYSPPVSAGPYRQPARRTIRGHES
jgi:hypothetical protein